MSKPPKQRKRYLEPSFGGDSLPRTTQYRLSCPNKRDVESSAADEPCDSLLDADDGLRNVNEDYVCDSEERGGCTPPPQSDFSAQDIVTLVMDFAVTHGLSWTQVENLMKLMSFILKRNDLPDSKFLFKKFAGISQENITFHWYCPDCICVLGECGGDIKKRTHQQLTCVQCKRMHTAEALSAQGAFFVSLPIVQQLNSVLSSKEVARSLKTVLQRISGLPGSASKRDITDGDLYCQQRKELNLSDMDISVTVNTDGSPVFNSSKFSIWPVQITINELPPSQRCKNSVVAQLWYGQSHPDMTMVLQAFSKQMNTLAETGVEWEVDGEAYNSKVYCFSASADAPARALMQNMVQYNGYFGCSWCLHPGKSVEGTVKYPLSEAAVPDRTKADVLKDMAEATRTGTHVRGVKGPSPLISLLGFDIVWSFSPDYMHCVLLGVARQFMELWLSNVGAPYYIGSPQLLNEIDERLCHIKPPQCITRLPRSILLRKFWKAAEWQQWLLYFSLVCLDGILPNSYFEHFSFLVKGIYLLLQDEVSHDDITKSTEYLVQFTVGVQFQYSEKEMTSNVHSLLHLAKSVILQGPLWAHSCFGFESDIGKLKGLITSAKGVPHQVMSRVLMAHKVHACKDSVSPEVKHFLQSTKMSKKEPTVLGKPKLVAGPLLKLIESQVPSEITGPVEEHDRVLISGRVFHSEQYQRPDKTDCTAVRMPNNVCLKIQHIVSVCCSDKKRVYIVARNYVASKCFGTTHIVRIERWAAQKVVEIDENATACVWLECKGKYFFCNLVNRFLL